MVGLPNFRTLLLRLCRSVVGPVVGVAVVAYFGYHAIQGDRGLLALAQLEAEVAQSRVVLAELQAERRHLENLTTRLRPDSLDLDLLDERARVMLNLAHPHDQISLSPGRRPAPPASPPTR